MQRVKTRIFSGSVCEQIVFNVPDRVRDIKKAEPRPRFKTPEEREQHRIGISKRNHARLFNIRLVQLSSLFPAVPALFRCPVVKKIIRQAGVVLAVVYALIIIMFP